MASGLNQCFLYAYDGLGRVLTETLPDGKLKRTQYNDTTNTITVTDEEGNQKKTVYTPLGKIQQEYALNPDTLLKSYTYDPSERAQSETSYDTDGNPKLTVSYTYDAYDRITAAAAVGNGVNQLESHSYVDSIDKKYSSDQKTIAGDSAAPGIVSTTYADMAGQVVKEVLGAAVVGSTYDKAGNKITQTDALQNTTRWSYDYAGRVLTECNALNQISRTEYDALGNKIKSIDYAGNEVAFAYDIAGRLLTQESPFDDSRTAQTKYYYDAAGNLIRQKVQIDTDTWRETAYTYDSRSRQTDAYLYENADCTAYSRTHYVYDDIGNKLAVYTGLDQNSPADPEADEACAKTGYTYDRFGNVLTTTDPMGGVERFEYDATGLLQAKTDRNGNRTEYEYDALNRPVRESVTVQKGDGELISARTTVYTRTGQKASESDMESRNGGEAQILTINYKYDNMGRVVEQRDPGEAVKVYTYDLNGNRLGFTLTRNGETEMQLAYEYDALGRMTAVRDADGAEFTRYTYDQNGNRKTLVYPNSVETRYEYNDANLVTKLENLRGGAVTSSWEYGYQTDGNQISKTNKDGVATTYEYDLLGRLVRECDPDWNTIAYRYDRFGNRSEMTVSGDFENYVTAYTYDLRNRLLLEEKRQDKSAEFTKYTYDQNGNQVARQWRRLRAADGDTSVGRVGFAVQGFHGDKVALDLREYDGFGRQIRVYRDSVQTLYRYRPDGLRHSKTTGVAHRARSGDVTTVHLWDGQNIVADAGADGEIRSRYLRGAGLICQQIGELRHYYLFNAHGDVVQRVWRDNAENHASPMYIYDAFGNQYKPDASGDPHEMDGDPNVFRYCGEYFDSETQEIYLRARYYSPRTGRFGCEDPIASGLNWYAYCAGNPVTNVDPSGLVHYVFHYEKIQSRNGDGRTVRDVMQQIREQYGKDAEIVDYYIKDKDKFAADWAKMGKSKGKDVPIESVTILTHGEPNHLKAVNGDIITLDDIKSLEPKYIDTLLLLSCNSGHMDYGENVATAFTETQNVLNVLAVDGTLGLTNFGDGYTFKAINDEVFEQNTPGDREPLGFIRYRKGKGGGIERTVLGIDIAHHISDFMGMAKPKKTNRDQAKQASKNRR